MAIQPRPQGQARCGQWHRTPTPPADSGCGRGEGSGAHPTSVKRHNVQETYQLQGGGVTAELRTPTPLHGDGTSQGRKDRAGHWPKTTLSPIDWLHRDAPRFAEGAINLFGRPLLAFLSTSPPALLALTSRPRGQSGEPRGPPRPRRKRPLDHFARPRFVSGKGDSSITTSPPSATRPSLSAHRVRPEPTRQAEKRSQVQTRGLVPPPAPCPPWRSWEPKRREGRGTRGSLAVGLQT